MKVWIDACWWFCFASLGVFCWHHQQYRFQCASLTSAMSSPDRQPLLTLPSPIRAMRRFMSRASARATASLSSATIPPGGEAMLTLSVRPLAPNGAFKKNVFVHSDDPERPVLQLTQTETDGDRVCIASRGKMKLTRGSNC